MNAANVANSAWATLRSAIRSGPGALATANLASALMGILTGVMTARVLGPEGRGDLAVIILWPSLIATLVDVGVADAITLRVARMQASVGMSSAAALVIATGASVAGAAIGFVSLPVLLQESQAHLLDASLYALLFVPASLLSAVTQGALAGIHRFDAMGRIRVLSVLIYAVSLGVAILLGVRSVDAFMWITVAARALPFLLALPVLGRELLGRLDATCLREQLKEGAVLQSARLSTVASGVEDRVLASLTLSQASIGHWQVAAALSAVMPFVSQAVGQHLFATLPKTEETARGEAVFAAYVRAVAITGLLVAIAMPALPVLIPLVYGGDFRPAIVPGALVLAGTSFGAGVVALHAALRTALRVGACIESEAAGIVVMAASAVGLVRVWGMDGLAAAYALGRAAALAWSIRRASSAFGIPTDMLIPGSKAFLRKVLAEIIAARHGR